MAHAVQLTNGESVQLKLEAVCFPEQLFTRIGPRLIAGAVNYTPSERRSGLYVWYEIDGVYELLGDMSFYDEEDGSVRWEIYYALGGDMLGEREGRNTFGKHAREHLLKHAELLSNPLVTPNHVIIISMPEVCKWTPAESKPADNP